MKIQLLPNYFKWIGLIMYIVGGVPHFIKGFNEGANSSACKNCSSSEIPFYFSEQTFLITALISLLGMIIYSLSREKIEDEFIKVMRWQSVTIAFVSSIILIILNLLLYGIDDVMDGQSLVELQLLIYLISFFLKKRTAFD